MTIEVFYLDDEPQLCEIFEELFRSDVVNVKTFQEADEAIEACRVSPPDIFFIDYRLVGTSGFEVAAAVSEDIVKFLVTGEISISADDKFERVLYKPLDFAEIARIIDQGAWGSKR